MLWQKNTVPIEQVDDDTDTRTALYLWIVACVALFAVVALAIMKYTGRQSVAPVVIWEEVNTQTDARDAATSTAKAGPVTKEMLAVTTLRQLDLKDIDVNLIVPLALFTGDNKQRIAVIDKTQIVQSLYALPQKRNDGSVVVIEPVNDEPAIFLSGVGTYGFSVLDLYGNDLSPDRLYWREGDSVAQFMKYMGKDWIVHGAAPELQETLRGSTLLLMDFDRKVHDQIRIDDIEKKSALLRPIGWSRDRQFYYVVSVPIDATDRVALWRVDRQTKATVLVPGLADVRADSFVVNPYAQVAAGVVPSASGERLMFFNLATGEGTFVAEVAKSSTLSLSGDGAVLAYEEPLRDGSRLTLFYVQDQTRRVLGQSMTLLGLSYAGDTVVVHDWLAKTTSSQQITRMIVATGEKILLPIDKDVVSVEPIRCAYPLGFSCWYSK